MSDRYVSVTSAEDTLIPTSPVHVLFLVGGNKERKCVHGHLGTLIEHRQPPSAPLKVDLLEILPPQHAYVDLYPLRPSDAPAFSPGRVRPSGRRPFRYLISD